MMSDSAFSYANEMAGTKSVPTAIASIEIGLIATGIPNTRNMIKGQRVDMLPVRMSKVKRED